VAYKTNAVQRRSDAALFTLLLQSVGAAGLAIKC
jgi:hypothetical protein